MVRQNAYRVDVYRGNVKYREIRCADPPRIDASAGAEIKTSMRGTFRLDEDVDYMQDAFRPVLLLDGEEYPAGSFYVSRKSDLRTSSGALWTELECYDGCFFLKTTKTESILHFPAGARYLACVERLLVGAGITLYLETPSSAVLATDREDWEIGTDYLSIVNQLLGEINYNSVWFNADGYAVLEPAEEPDSSRIKHRFGSGNGMTMIKPETRTTVDIFSKPNVFIVLCSNPDLDAPLVARAINDNPLSGLSVFRRGRRITEVYRVNNIASQTELERYARRLCYESMLQSEEAEVETAIMPGHGVYDVVAVRHPALEGIFRETAWSMNLGPSGTMRHTLQRMILI